MKNIAIVGLGIIGGSFAKAIYSRMPHQYHVMGLDLDQTTLDKAQALGVIAEGETSNQTILQKADLVIIALYPTLVKQFIQDHKHYFKIGAVLTDTAGIKQGIMGDILPILPEEIDFIFGHPMAGRESQGFDFADERVFLHANYILTPHAGNLPENIDWLSDFIKAIGFGRITIATPHAHDEMIAYTSQLTHMIAAALINSDPFEHNTAEFIGDSFRELTRIAKMNESLWSELMLNNRDSLLEVMDAFEANFATLKKAVIEQNQVLLEKEFIESTERRLNLEATDQATGHAAVRGK